MKILVINAGSSTIKYKVISMPDEHVLCTGMVERIGTPKSTLHYESDLTTIEAIELAEDYEGAIKVILKYLLDDYTGSIKSTDEIDLVAHRVVHGGHRFHAPTFITDEVKEIIKEYEILAPLHNPNNLHGIELCESTFPTARHIAVFDTAFHSSIPEHVRQYAIPSSLAAAADLTKCGFHGISHNYVAQYAIQKFNLEHSKIVTLHLGSGCSATAVHHGKSIDHSMGISTGSGLIMGTRSGDIDHAIIFYLVNVMNYTLQEAEDLLNRESGLIGLTGYNDYRDVLQESKRGDESCLLALSMVAYRIRQYIGAYAASMNGLDALVFTGGIGEHASQLRKDVCTGMDYLDIELDDRANENLILGPQMISTDRSKVKVLVIPTNESLEIAREASDLVTG